MTSGAERNQLRRLSAHMSACPRPSACRAAHCGRRSSPIAATLAGTPRDAACPSGSFAAGHEHADAPHPLGLLRARRDRPRCRRTAEKRDELAPSHCCPRGLRTCIVAAQTDVRQEGLSRTLPMSALGQKRTSAAQAACPLYPQSGHVQRTGHVRFVPIADMQLLYSITSSARASSDGGTSRPSALAVLRLITSSYLVGACTGRSAGFSPLRMRST